jgi:hypothetical protein
MQRDLRSRSRVIMDSVEHGQSFTVRIGGATKNYAANLERERHDG